MAEAFFATRLVHRGAIVAHTGQLHRVPASMLEGLPVVPRRKIFYKGKELEEMDLDAIIQIHPEIVVVDELAHTNVEGSRNEKRWQDVMDLLDEASM